MWNIFKKDSDNQQYSDDVLDLQVSVLSDKLKAEGLQDDVVEKLLDNFTNSINEKITEKTEITYDALYDVIEKTVENIYFFTDDFTMKSKIMKDFIRSNSEVSGSVKLYASYIVYGSADVQLDEYKVVVIGEDTKKVKKAEKFINAWEKQSKIRRTTYLCSKDLVSYGDAFLEKVRDKNARVVRVAYIPAETILTKVDPYGKPIKYYQILDDKIRIANLEDNDVYESLQEEKKVIEFEPVEVQHFNDGSAIGYNDSPIKDLIIQWRFLKLLEESLLIHRITRARRFIIFFLDVTGKTSKAIRKAITNFTAKVKNMFTVNFTEGVITSEKSSLPTTADMVIPITKDSATKVQTLPSDVSATKVDDLKFYTNRLTTNMFTSHIFSVDKTGKEEYVEKAFMRLVRIYQKQMAYALEDLYNEILFENGFTDLSVEIQFPSPDTAEEVKVIDSVVRRMMVVNQLIATTGIVPPNTWIVDYVFKDMSRLQVKQLISMLEYAQKQQEEAAEGSEYPTFFKTTDSVSVESKQPSIYDKVDIEDSEMEEESTESAGISGNPFALDGALSNKIIDSLFSLNTDIREKTSRQQKEDVSEYVERLSAVINQSMEYLNLNKNKKEK